VCQPLEPIVYTVHILAPATQYAEVEAIVPTDGAQVVEMMMPIWSSVDQSSRDVWNNSNSGINPSVDTVSYYNKGQVLGLLLDARIRRATNGRRSLDDVMRLAYQRFAGERGFTEAEFRALPKESPASI
jgi:predicted metalloprotease with PDZ domain